MKRYLLYSTVLFVVVGVTILLIKQTGNQSLKTESNRPNFTIAVFSPAIHPSLTKIEQAYVKALTQSPHASYTITYYNGAGDGQRIGLFAKKIVNNRFDAIFTIGTGVTILTKNLLQKQASLTPLIFTAVAAPQKTGIDQQTAHVTGVIEENDFDTHIALIHELFPALREIVLIYCPTGGSNLDDDRQIIEKSAQRRSLLVTTIEVFSSAEIPAKTTTAIQHADAVMILKDNVVVSGLDGLVKLCNTFGKPLMASDLDSIDRGAFSAIGVYEEQFGIQGAQLTREILEKGTKPEQLPFTRAGKFVCALNHKQLARFGISTKKIDTLKTEFPMNITY